MEQCILDVCCGSRMFWFNKKNPNAIFTDIRKESLTLCDGRSLDVNPDLIADFRNLPFGDNTFKLVVFDPPQIENSNPTSYMAQKYGTLRRHEWKDDIKQGFDECMRVLEHKGVLIFKWNETRITVATILKVIGYQPLFGHMSGKASKTHWMCFMKGINS